MGVSETLSELTLSAVVDGRVDQVDLGVPIGESIVAVATYPSDFGPQAGQSATLLRACEHLAAERDVVGIGVAPESVYSHRKFASEADLSLPLVSDPAHEVASELDILETRADGVTVPGRSLHVLDYRGSVVAEWVATDRADQPNVQAFQKQVGAISPETSAWGCYRVGYARYLEGRRLLSRGFSQCEDEQWDVGQSSFEGACSEFARATDTFMKGQGLAEGRLTRLNDRGRKRSRQLWEAAEWLAGFAMAAAKGDEGRKQRDRTQAARVLETLRDADELDSPQHVLDEQLAQPA